MSLIQEKSFTLSRHILRLSKHIRINKKEFELASQILRSGTSVGANVREAQHAESKADFIHKLSIAQKEANETLYWLELFVAEDIITQKEFDKTYKIAVSTYKIVTSIIVSTKKNLR